jgi:hypothetical protein
VELYTLKNTSGLFFGGHFVKLLDKIWWTKKSKIEAEKRLLANAFQAQILLLWYSYNFTKCPPKKSPEVFFKVYNSTKCPPKKSPEVFFKVYRITPVTEQAKKAKSYALYHSAVKKI